MHGAEILVTTEKDRINCPKHLERSIAPLELAWLKIEFELENEPAFFDALEHRLEGARLSQVSRKAGADAFAPPK
jgi:tetraacyldisaccharide-1-P 4'-kinase